jgi:sugar phosphate isomerase/epimerase
VGQPFETLLRTIDSSKIKNWEIVDEDTLRLNEKRVKSLQELKKRLDLTYTIHAPFEDLNVATLNMKRRESTLTTLLRSIDLAAKVDAQLWVVHPGLYSGLDWAYPHRQWSLNLEAIETLREKAQSLGLTITVENMPRHSFILGSCRDFETFVRERSMNKSRMAFDIGHANTFSQVGEFLKQFGNRISHIHLHDNYGERDEHNMIGRGTVDWSVLKDFLTRGSFQGLIVIESVKNTLESLGKAKSMLGVDW